MGKEKYASGAQKILWIEDDYYHVKGLAKPLIKAGFKMVPARSYVEATLLLKEWRSFCLIILDLIIPYSEFEATDSQLATSHEKNYSTEDIHSLVQNGLAIFDYMTEDLKVNIPIVILSVVRTKEIIDPLVAKGATVNLEKLSLLPQEVMDIVTKTIEERKSSIGSKNST